MCACVCGLDVSTFIYVSSLNVHIVIVVTQNLICTWKDHPKMYFLYSNIWFLELTCLFFFLKTPPTTLPPMASSGWHSNPSVSREIVANQSIAVIMSARVFPCSVAPLRSETAAGRASSETADGAWMCGDETDGVYSSKEKKKQKLYVRNTYESGWIARWWHCLKKNGKTALMFHSKIFKRRLKCYRDIKYCFCSCYSWA